MGERPGASVITVTCTVLASGSASMGKCRAAKAPATNKVAKPPTAADPVLHTPIDEAFEHG